MKKLKITIIIFINSIILLSLLELGLWYTYKKLGKFPQGLFFVKKKTSDPCGMFIFDLQLSTVHDDTAGCKVRGAKINNGIVEYNFIENKFEKTIKFITLGGSTTDGYFTYANQFSWPYYFYEICNEKFNRKNIYCDVKNGGVGGFSTSRELLKLFRDIINPAELESNFIISLNGINDLKHSNNDPHLEYWFFDELQIATTFEEKFKITYAKNIYLPNIRRALNRSMEILSFTKKTVENKDNKKKFLENKYFVSIPESGYKSTKSLYEKNLKLSHYLSKYKSIEYNSFLQPTMGLYSNNNDQMSDNDNELYSELKYINSPYIKRMNKKYDEFRDVCKTLDYCHDISNIIKYDKENDYYSDPRHPNKLGNKIIAKEIFQILEDTINGSKHIK